MWLACPAIPVAGVIDYGAASVTFESECVTAVAR